MSLQKIINEYTSIYKLSPLLYSDELSKNNLADSAKFTKFVDLIVTFHAINKTDLKYKAKNKAMYEDIYQYIETKKMSKITIIDNYSSAIIAAQTFEILFKSLYYMFSMYSKTIKNLDTKILQNSVHKYLSNNAHMTLYLMFYNTNIIPQALTQQIIDEMKMNTSKNDILLQKCKEFFSKTWTNKVYVCNFNPKYDTQQTPDESEKTNQKKKDTTKQNLTYQGDNKVSIEDPYALLMLVSVSQMLQQ